MIASRTRQPSRANDGAIVIAELTPGVADTVNGASCQPLSASVAFERKARAQQVPASPGPAHVVARAREQAQEIATGEHHHVQFRRRADAATRAKAAVREGVNGQAVGPENSAPMLGRFMVPSVPATCSCDIREHIGICGQRWLGRSSHRRRTTVISVSVVGARWSGVNTSSVLAECTAACRPRMISSRLRRRHVPSKSQMIWCLHPVPVSSGDCGWKQARARPGAASAVDDGRNGKPGCARPPFRGVRRRDLFIAPIPKVATQRQAPARECSMSGGHDEAERGAAQKARRRHSSITKESRELSLVNCMAESQPADSES